MEITLNNVRYWFLSSSLDFYRLSFEQNTFFPFALFKIIYNVLNKYERENLILIKFSTKMSAVGYVEWWIAFKTRKCLGREIYYFLWNWILCSGSFVKGVQSLGGSKILNGHHFEKAYKCLDRRERRTGVKNSYFPATFFMNDPSSLV